VVFIGGSGTQLDALLNQCWQRLAARGRMLVVSISEHSRSRLHLFSQQREAFWSQIAYSKDSLLANQRTLQPQFPVLLVKFVKSTA
jgi:precorrin-6B methylase 2